MLATRSGLPAGSTILVQGASGGVSTALIQLGRAMGMRVWATSRSEEGRDRATGLGAHQAFEQGARLPERVDGVFESVGRSTWAHSMRAVRPGGVIVCCGATSGADPSADLQRLFFLQISVIGSTMGTLDELRRLIAFCAAAGVQPGRRSDVPAGPGPGGAGAAGGRDPGQARADRLTSPVADGEGSPMRRSLRAFIPLVGVLASTAMSVTANSVVAIAVPWLVLERTGSAALAGLAGAAAIAPIVFSAVFGGALIDRIGKKRCSMIADTLSALAVAAIPVADLTIGLGMGLLLALVALGAVFDSPGAASREALRPDVARRAGVPLARVNAWGEAAEGIGYLAGPALAGLLLLLVGGFGTLWTSVVLFGLAMITTAVTIPGISRPARSRSRTCGRSRRACCTCCGTARCGTSRWWRRWCGCSSCRSRRWC